MSQKLILISPYPPQGTVYENKFSALASFGKNTVLGLLANCPNLEILVLADIIHDSRNYQEKNVSIKRAWERGRLNVYQNLIKEIIKEKQTKNILIELEWNLFGKKPFLIVLMPFFILFLRFLGKKVFVVTHGIALDFLSLTPQLGLKKEGLQARILNLGIKFFYALLYYFSTKMIVLEQAFADNLNGKFKAKKTVFIPHGVDAQIKTVDKNSARIKLGIPENVFLLVNFGFLTWYKGSDLMADSFLKLIQKGLQKNVQLVFAGGPSHVHKTEPVYAEFIKKIEKSIAQSEQMKLTGFLSEEEISFWFSAADLLIFPYRVFISSSGPLSFAFSFKKPILLSARLRDYFASEDMCSSLSSADLRPQDLLFEPNENDLEKKLAWAKKEINLNRLKKFSELMREKRAWSKVGKKYLELIFPENC